MNFLVRTCQHCGVDVSVGAGDVIFGDSWYHSECWKRLRGFASERKE